ncbi:LPS export ABC transporter permease LptG [Plastorhodobacter daqingensis]|uniref:LPS export ABC transporter permease LptG n=1 Tax=Plastorhodobacter daqingensis TaxID=1387281 RepID=A0ABW2UJY0_9RHOB
MTLARYFARRFLRAFAIVLGVFAGMLLLLDMVEQIRRLSGSAPGLGPALELAALNMPEGVYRILPLIVILAALLMFLSLARSSELVVTRAAGVSALRSLVAPVATAVLLGVLAVAVLNPLIAATSKRYEARAGQLTGSESVLSISREGLWLRQGGAEGQTVIRAQRASLDGTVLQGVTFLTFAPESGPARRIEAAEARLTPGAWQVQDAKDWPLDSDNPERDARRHAAMTLPTDLTLSQIRDSFGTPSAIPIWDLPAFIGQLERAGFSARQHRVWFQMELALPLLMGAMVLIAAAFAMRPPRLGRTGPLVLIALLAGLGIFFLRNFAQVLGENGQIPVILAAWSPPIAAALLALGLILHLEDG